MKKSIIELAKEVGAISIKHVNKTYRHHSGKVFKVVGVAIDCKTNEILLNYNIIEETLSLAPVNMIFSRPAKDFVEPTFTQVRQMQVWLTDEEAKKYYGEKNELV